MLFGDPSQVHLAIDKMLLVHINAYDTHREKTIFLIFKKSDS